VITEVWLSWEETLQRVRNLTTASRRLRLASLAPVAWCACGSVSSSGNGQQARACTCTEYDAPVFLALQIRILVIKKLMSTVQQSTKHVALELAEELDALLPIALEFETQARANVGVPSWEYTGSVKCDYTAVKAPADLSRGLHLLNFWFDECPRGIPVLHLLCKTLPQRCQYRNLKSIIQQYASQDPKFGLFIRRVLVFCLLGRYDSADSAPPFNSRLRVYKLALGMEERATVGNYDDLLLTTNLVFVALKEYMLQSISADPALYAMLHETYKWGRYENYARECARSMRHLLTMGVDFETMNDEMATKSFRQARHLIRLRKRTFSVRIYSQLGTARRVAHSLPCDQLRVVKRIADADTAPTSLAWADRFAQFAKEGILSEQVCARLYNLCVETTTVARFNEVCEAALEEAPTLAAVISTVREVHAVSHMPIGTSPTAFQLSALVVRYRVPCPADLPDDAGCIYVCHSCREVRGYVVSASVASCTATSSSFRIRANHSSKKPAGNAGTQRAAPLTEHRILHNRTTKRAKAGGGTPPPCAAAPGDVAASDKEAGAAAGAGAEGGDARKRGCLRRSAGDFAVARTSKSHWNIGAADTVLDTKTNLRYCARSSNNRRRGGDACYTVPLVKVSLLGRVVTIFGRAYSLCTSCGCTAEWSIERVGQNSFTCGACAEDVAHAALREVELAAAAVAKIAYKCALCTRECTQGGLLEVFEDTCRPFGFVRIALCGAHRRGWFKGRHPYLKSHLFKQLGV